MWCCCWQRQWCIESHGVWETHKTIDKTNDSQLNITRLEWWRWREVEVEEEEEASINKCYYVLGSIEINKFLSCIWVWEIPFHFWNGIWHPRIIWWVKNTTADYTFDTLDKYNSTYITLIHNTSPQKKKKKLIQIDDNNSLEFIIKNQSQILWIQQDRA